MTRQSWSSQSAASPRELVVFTHAALAASDSADLRRASEPLRGGQLALLDRPMEFWESTAGLRDLGRQTLPSKWPEQRWSTWSPSPRPSRRDAADSPHDATSLAPNSIAQLPPLELEYLVLRPIAHGVRNVGRPLGLPTVWWKPEGQGGWITLGLPLAEILDAIRSHDELDQDSREHWASVVLESCLDPDIFPRPYPRVWPHAALDAPGEAGPPHPTRATLNWSTHVNGAGGFRIEFERSSPGLELEFALPQRWRNQVLVDWDADWPGARSRKRVGYGREWRIVRAPEAEGSLELSYRLTEGNSPWR